MGKALEKSLKGEDISGMYMEGVSLADKLGPNYTVHFVNELDPGNPNSLSSQTHRSSKMGQINPPRAVVVKENNMVGAGGRRILKTHPAAVVWLWRI